MNFFRLAPGLFYATFLLVACAGKDKKIDRGASAKLQGAWKIIKAEGTAAAMNMGTVYEFKGNTLTLSTDMVTNPGVTEVTDSTFSYKPNNNERIYMYNYRFKGDTLVAEIDISNGQIFYLLRK